MSATDPQALRIVFLGTPEFAVASLRALIEANLQVVAVVTAPDKPAGRKKALKVSAVKQFARENDLPVLQPTNLKAPEFAAELAAYKADLQIVVAFRMMPEVIWNQPPMGTFNLHASLLPQYRGAAPINRAVMNGEAETGVSTFQLQHAIDTGEVLLQKKIDIGPNENAGLVHDRLMDIGAQLVVATVVGLASGNLRGTPQSAIATMSSLKEAPKIFREDCRIQWHQPAKVIHNHVRGLSPYPAAWTHLISPNGEKLLCKVGETALTTEVATQAPGSILTDGKTYIKVATEEGLVALQQIQPAGRRSLDIKAFLNGYALSSQWRFE